jgi:hypothetical protein
MSFHVMNCTSASLEIRDVREDVISTGTWRWFLSDNKIDL